MDYPSLQNAVSNQSSAVRAEFIRKTYVHLAGAIFAFVLLEAALITSGAGAVLTQTILGTRWGWALVLAAFMAVGWVAERWARSATSVGTQYLGLGLYVVAEAIVMAPMLYVAAAMTGSGDVIAQAAVYTGLIFTGLTGTVFFMRTDFSFMRGALAIAGMVALGTIVCSIIFGFTLGVVFSGLMVALAAGYILYYTSNVLHHYPVGSHVAASLALFSSVALLFWYVLRLLMSLNRR
ncbi:MAG: Bax inhibitor-1/YccA family protein [Myxococcaceae bacterium]